MNHCIECQNVFEASVTSAEGTAVNRIDNNFNLA